MFGRASSLAGSSVSAVTRSWSGSRGRRRAPLVPVAVLFAAGVLISSRAGVPAVAWAVVACVLLVCWAAAWRNGWPLWSAVLLLAAVLATGGYRQQLAAAPERGLSIATVATAERKLVRLAGTVEQEPRILRRTAEDLESAWIQPERTRCVITVQSLDQNGTAIAVTGRVQLTVSGHLLSLHAGDRVSVAGWLFLPRPPANPGEPDFREYLHGQGIAALMTCSHPAAVQQVAAGRRWPHTIAAGAIRHQLNWLLLTQFEPEQRAVAEALLLGERGGIDRELREDFGRSGAMHVLAISGLHAGLFAAMLWFAARLCGMSRRQSAVLVLLGTLGYAVFTGARPPVVRAWVLIALVAGGAAAGRAASLLNSLAAAALLLMLVSPSVVQDVGAQLSFLAMLAIAACTELPLMRQPATPRIDLLEEEGSLRAMLRHGGRVAWRRTMQLAVMTGAIWCLTAPLVAARFQLVSLAGLLLNLVLIPLLGLVLWSGYFFLAVGLLVPELARYAAVPLRNVLELFLWLVQSAADLPFAAVATGIPPVWWLAVYYGFLLVVLLFPLASRVRWKWLLRGVPAWVVCGLTVAVLPGGVTGRGSSSLFTGRPAAATEQAVPQSVTSSAAEAGRLRCTFLSVGHGLAVVLELPDGRTVLYDCGSLGNRHRATRTLLQALQFRGIGAVDTAIVSHADSDHFNGLGGLVRRIPVRQLVVPQGFAALGQRNVARLCDELHGAGTAIVVAVAGDVLTGDASWQMDFLHPPAGFEAGSDNMGSLVARLRYGGRTILLTGDLEDEGLSLLLDRPPESVDVLLAPHHGSLAANPQSLASWASPRAVVISTADAAASDRLARRYEETALLYNTAVEGAVEVLIDAAGQLRVTPFLK